MRLVLLGAPGSGKGTQAAFLRERLAVPHISTGDIFRHNLKEETPIGLKAKQYMDKGALVPDDIVLEMVADRLDFPDAQKGFILDGFPRTTSQAEFLDSFLRSRKVALDKVVLFNIGDDALVSRLSNRRLCRQCGAIHNFLLLGERNAGCRQCGGELFQRDDDREDVIRHRLGVFHEQTLPLVRWYETKGLLVTLDADQAPELVQKNIEKMLEDRHGEA